MRLAAAEGDDAGSPGDEPAYKVDAVNADLKKQKFDMDAILRDGKAPAGGWAAFDSYYNDYILARWSLPAGRAALPDYRKQLRNSLHIAKGAAHDHLNDLALEFMKAHAAENYHPAVRVNAMLMIGDLNRVEPIGGAAVAPLPEALTMLLDAVKSGKLPDAVRAAAMVGILRHAEVGIADENARRSLTAAMLRVTAEDPPAGPAAPGREWILGQAVETLGLLKSVGEDAAVYKALLKTVDDGKLRLCTRCIAAASLGKLNYADAAGIDPSQAAGTLAQLASDACVDELRRTTDAGSETLRRRTKQRLDAVLAALKPIAALAHEPQQPALAALQKDLKDLSDLLDDKAHKDDNMKPRIEDLRKKLEAWLQKKPA
jgi:hypothetical protein